MSPPPPPPKKIASPQVTSAGYGPGWRGLSERCVPQVRGPGQPACQPALLSWMAYLPDELTSRRVRQCRRAWHGGPWRPLPLPAPQTTRHHRGRRPTHRRQVSAQQCRESFFPFLVIEIIGEKNSTNQQLITENMYTSFSFSNDKIILCCYLRIQIRL